MFFKYYGYSNFIENIYSGINMKGIVSTMSFVTIDSF